MSWKNGELWIRKKMRTARGMMVKKIKKASGRTRKQVFPFAGNTDENSGSGGASGDRYRYYDMGQMTSELVIYDDVYREAQQLVADGRVKLVDVTEGYIRRGPAYTPG